MRRAALLPLLLVFVAASALSADDPVKRATLQVQPFPGPVLHTIMTRAEIAPGGEVPFHTHPGIEMGYVASGEAVLARRGQADLTLKAGDSFSIPQGLVHSLKNAGQAPLVVISTYVVDQNKPLVIPAS
jgi:quercetin dioxygenase-like cupin family protein